MAAALRTRKRERSRQRMSPISMVAVGVGERRAARMWTSATMMRVSFSNKKHSVRHQQKRAAAAQKKNHCDTQAQKKTQKASSRKIEFVAISRLQRRLSPIFDEMMLSLSAYAHQLFSSSTSRPVSHQILGHKNVFWSMIRLLTFFNIKKGAQDKKHARKSAHTRKRLHSAFLEV